MKSFDNDIPKDWISGETVKVPVEYGKVTWDLAFNKGVSVGILMGLVAGLILGVATVLAIHAWIS